MLEPDLNRKHFLSIVPLPPGAKGNDRPVRTKMYKIRNKMTVNIAIFSELVEVVDKNGVGKLAIVAGANNTEVHVHHVLEDGVPNPDTDVEVATAVATTVATGVADVDVPPSTYDDISSADNIVVDNNNIVVDNNKPRFYKRSHLYKDVFKLEAFDWLTFQTQIFLSIRDNNPGSWVNGHKDKTVEFLDSWKVLD